MTCKQRVKMQFLQVSFKFAGAKKTLSKRVMTKINHARHGEQTYKSNINLSSLI